MARRMVRSELARARRRRGGGGGGAVKRRRAFERLEERLALTVFYDFQVVAQTGQNGITDILGAPSINDRGETAFAAAVSGGEAIFVADAASGATNITPGFVSSTRSFRPELEIANDGRVGAIDRTSGSLVGTRARI